MRWLLLLPLRPRLLPCRLRLRPVRPLGAPLPPPVLPGRAHEQAVQHADEDEACARWA